MSDGRTHFALWRGGLILIPPLMIMGWYITAALPLIMICSLTNCYGAQVFIALGIPLGYVLGAFIDPDMDIVGMTEAEGRLMNNLWVLGGLLVAYWTFYGFLFRRHHRSVWTHGPIISTAIRYCYQFWGLFIWIYNSKQDLAWLILLLIGMFIGTTLSDTIHYSADKISGELRRIK